MEIARSLFELSSSLLSLAITLHIIWIYLFENYWASFHIPIGQLCFFFFFLLNVYFFPLLMFKIRLLVLFLTSAAFNILGRIGFSLFVTNIFPVYLFVLICLYSCLNSLFFALIINNKMSEKLSKDNFGCFVLCRLQMGIDENKEAS